MAKHTHYFLALPMKEETEERLSSWRDELNQRFSFKTWVHPKDYHITLAFLGNISLDQITRINEKVNHVCKQHHPFSLELNGIGIFGKNDSPRIFWAGVKKEPSLFLLQREIKKACTSIGFTLEDREYHPHITLARKWNTDEPFNVKKLEQFNGKINPYEFRTDEVVLFQTHLDQSPKYEPILRFSLGK